MTVYTAYHGSTYSFGRPTSFAKLKGMDFGPGFYFALDRRDAEGYGPYVYRAQIRVDHPIVVSDRQVDRTLVTRLARAIRASEEDVALGVEEGVHPIAYIFELARTLIDVGTMTHVALRNFLIKIGYDGVVVDAAVSAAAMRRGGASSTVHGDYVAVFSPDQILSWERSAAMRPNLPPSVPPGGRHLMSWIQRTYAVGTPVKLGWNQPVPWSNEIIPAGARGVVGGHYFDLDALDHLGTAQVIINITDARRPDDGSIIDDLIGRDVTVDALHFVRTKQDLAHWLTPLDDNWATVQPKRYSSPKPRKTTSRRVRPNTVPPPPDLKDDSSWTQWWNITYPRGASAKMLVAASFWHESGHSKIWDYDCSRDPPGSCSVYPSGVVTIGGDGPHGVEIYFVIPYGPDAGRWSRWVGPAYEAGRDQIVRMLKPLDDNWAQFQPKKHYAAPRPRKTTSRRVRPNTIPPPPVGGDDKDRERWQSITYAAGTPVRLKHTVEFREDPRSGTFFPMRRYDDGDMEMSPGTRGVVHVYKPSYVSHGQLQFFVDITDARDSSGLQVPNLVGRRVAMFESLRYGSGAQHRWDDWEPLVDNWAPLQSTKRYGIHRPRKTTSRRGPRPNRRTSKRRTSRKTGRMRP